MSAAQKPVAVVGVETIGSRAARRPVARGAEAVGRDRHAPGHDRSAAGGLSQAPHKPAGGPNQRGRTVQPSELETCGDLIGRCRPQT